MKKVTISIVAFALISIMILPAVVSSQRRRARNPSREGQPATIKTVASQSRLPTPLRQPSLQPDSAPASAAGRSLVPAQALLPFPEPQYVPNQVLIQLDQRNNDSVKVAVSDALDGVGFQTVKIVGGTDQGDLILATLPNGRSVDSAISKVRNLPGVRFAQKNWLYATQQAVSDDQEYVNGNLWGMYGDDQPTPTGPDGTTYLYGCQAEKAWAAGHTGSRNIVVGVIDQGVQYDHPDLAANIWTNPGEIADNNKDDDHNGWTDDIHGWDFFNDDKSVYDGGESGNADRHGTQVAGTVGAVGGNAIGVAGVNWNVTIIPAKFLGPDGVGPTHKAVEAIDYLVELKRDRGINIVAINASWGGGGYDLALFEAIKRAARQNILFIAAAGNGDAQGRPINTDYQYFYPACYDTTVSTLSNGGTNGVDYDCVISVAAIKSNGKLAQFSNYGSKTVDLGAPGNWIISTSPKNAYRPCSGTSMAAPHVTGAVALYASTHPGATARDIKSKIMGAATVTATSSLKGKTVSGGCLNVSSF